MSGSFLDLNVPDIGSFAVAPVDIRMLYRRAESARTAAIFRKPNIKTICPTLIIQYMCQKLYEGIRNQKSFQQEQSSPTVYCPSPRMAFGNMLGVELNEGFDLFAPSRLSVIRNRGDFEGGIL